MGTVIQYDTPILESTAKENLKRKHSICNCRQRTSLGTLEAASSRPGGKHVTGGGKQQGKHAIQRHGPSSCAHFVERLLGRLIAQGHIPPARPPAFRHRQRVARRRR
jgi:hypothetical protein